MCLQNVTTVPVSAGSIHVTVEPSGMDTSYMQMEDFTSQQVSDVAEVAIGHMEEIACEETVAIGTCYTWIKCYGNYIEIVL